jgi:hypothetical protein
MHAHVLGSLALVEDALQVKSNFTSVLWLQATLEEVSEADVLIHVMNGDSPQMLHERQAVLSILRQLGELTCCYGLHVLRAAKQSCAHSLQDCKPCVHQ